MGEDGSRPMTEEEAAASMCSRLPERLHEQAHLLVDRWDRPILPVPGIRELKEAGYGVYLLPTPATGKMSTGRAFPAVSILTGTLISADVKLVKPCAEIYELLYSTFDLTPLSACLSMTCSEHREGAGAYRHAGHSFSRRRGRASRRNESLRVKVGVCKNKPEHLLVFRFFCPRQPHRAVQCAVAAASQSSFRSSSSAARLKTPSRRIYTQPAPAKT